MFEGHCQFERLSEERHDLEFVALQRQRRQQHVVNRRFQLITELIGDPLTHVESEILEALMHRRQHLR